MSEGQVNLGLSLGRGGASRSGRNPSSFPAPPHLSLVSFPLAPPCLKPVPAAPRSAVAAGSQRCGLFPSSSSAGRHRHSGNCSSVKGIDVNREPTASILRKTTEDEEEDGVSSPNSTVSSAVSGGGGGNNKGDERRQTGSNIRDEKAPEGTLSRAINDEGDGGEGSRNRKLRLSKVQAAVLEESFKEHHTLNPRQKLALAKQLHLRPRQVEVWFQNRRARTKLKQTEVDCELLRRFCENLTEDNRRLQREVQELRALKLLAPQHYAHIALPTTLTFCPSCERVAPAVNPNPAAVTASLLAAAAGPNQLPQFPLHPHGFSPGHFLPMQRRTVPAASTGHSFPLAPASLRATAWADASPPP